MQVTIEELEQALINADAAGDVEAASAIASEIDDALLQQIKSPQSATEVLTKPKSFWENITAPNEPEPLDIKEAGKRVATSGAIGAGIGAVLPVVGPTVGGVGGVLGGIGEEVGRIMGVSDLARFAMGAGMGGLAELGPMAARLGTKLVVPVRANLGSAGGARTTTYASSGGIVSDRIQNLAVRDAQVKLFGKPIFDLDIEPTNFYNSQIELASNYLGKIDVPYDKTVSSVLRKNLYEEVKNVSKKTTSVSTTTPPVYDSLGLVRTPAKTTTTEIPNVFSTSPEFKLLMDDVVKLAKREKADPGQIKKMVKILRNELDPDVQATSMDDIINLIQNGGAYQASRIGGEPEIKTLISDDMKDVLRNRFNEYLERTVGAAKYNQLKNVERAEFVAKAKDYIPELINSGWKTGSKEYKEVMRTVTTSPETRQEFGKAVLQHLASFDNYPQLRGELRRLGAGLKEAKILDDKQLREMYSKIRAFETTKSNALKFNQAKALVLTPLVSATSAEVSKPMVSNSIWSL